MARADVTILGAGIFGLSIAWACAKRGARVRVIDPGGVGAGSSGGLVGALSPHVPEAWNTKKAFQFGSLLMAGDWWAEVVAASGRSAGYARLGRLQPLADQAAVDLARERAASAAKLWQGKAQWEVVPATGGALEPRSATGWLVRDTLAARLSPRLALESLAVAILNRGATLERSGESVGTVVHATGVAGLAALSESLGRKVGTGVKGQALALRFTAPDAPQILVDGLHIVPHADGTVAVGSTSERDWQSEGPDGQLDGLLAKAVDAVPALGEAEVVARWAGVRPRAASRAPVLGAWPGRPGHFVANGGFKIGFGMAPGVAEVMAELVLEGRDWVPDGFRLTAP
ncbi:MAG: FAD-binding oxidoreductase [Tabrizicola sp.]|jgi:glycine/D-amino acid oxidase-like deaminating enzyme|nr:FAD-binding oxidoreductase [Tabrizicola sp.]